MWLSWNVGEFGLHALSVEKLSSSISRNVCWPCPLTDYRARSRRLLRHVDMACFFGMPGSNNDINVLDASNLFADLREGCSPANYTIMGNHYNMGYNLANDIYPKWATIV